MDNFAALISVKGRPNLSFVAYKRRSTVGSMSKNRYNQQNPGQLDLPEYLVTNAHYRILGGMAINSLNDITGMIGNGNVIKIILRVIGRQDVTLCIGGDEGRVVETHVKEVTLRKQRELMQQQFQTIEEFNAALSTPPSLQELAANAADPGELAFIRGDVMLRQGGKKTRNKRKKRKSMKR